MKLSHATDHKKTFLLGCFLFSFILFYFSVLILSFYSELCCWDIFSLNFMKRNISTVICPSERKKNQHYFRATPTWAWGLVLHIWQQSCNRCHL